MLAFILILHSFYIDFIVILFLKAVCLKSEFHEIHEIQSL